MPPKYIEPSKSRMDEIRERYEKAKLLITETSMKAVNAVAELQDKAPADIAYLLQRVERLEEVLRLIEDTKTDSAEWYMWMARQALSEDGETE